jgi:hypothetical protein
MFGCAIKGWGVPRWDGCIIGENPLSMDGFFPGWMDLSAMDRRFFGEISLMTKSFGCAIEG